MKQKLLTPEAAVAALIETYDRAVASLRTSLDRYFETRQPPTPAERRGFCYPQLIVHYESHGLQMSPMGSNPRSPVPSPSSRAPAPTRQPSPIPAASAPT